MSQAFDPQDLALHQRITEIHCIPQLQMAAATVQVSKEDKTLAAIWSFALDASRSPRQLTSGAAQDSCPRWSPDGSQLAFLSTRNSDLPQSYLMATDGGEARQLGDFANGLMTMAWRPDGADLLAIASIDVDPEARGGRPERAVTREPDAPRLVWRLPYKQDGMGYQLDREVHLFVVDASSGRRRQLTDGPFDVQGAAWSPDGKRIAYVRRREAPEADCSDIWLIEVDGAGNRRLSFEQPTAQSPTWSPDGRHIVFTGSTDAGDGQMRLWCVEAAGGDVAPLGDESIEAVPLETPVWSEDGSRLGLIVARDGLQEVVTVTVPEGRMDRLVTGARQVTALSATCHRLAYCCVSVGELDTLYSCDWQGMDERRHSNFNPWFLERTPLTAELRSFQVPDGEGGSEQVNGWLIRAKDAEGPQPLLVDVHGGPAGYVLLDLTARAYWRVLCSKGWSVLALNAVGSSSFGRDFSARLRGRWGELDLPQHLAAVDCLVQEGVADERLAIAGKSYGGYLSAWAIGHTQRFRAAAISAPVGNLESHYGTSDSGYYSDPYAMCGEPHLNREASDRLSPLKHIWRARTPTLFLQGEEDQRCPKGQSEELFVTLSRATGTPAEMVLYPGGGHHFYEDGKLSHRIDAVRRVVVWLCRWIEVPVRNEAQG
jgi:dipeptidyl aminopeptidase/acylaminoacyl peptidase